MRRCRSNRDGAGVGADASGRRGYAADRTLMNGSGSEGRGRPLWSAPTSSESSPPSAVWGSLSRARLAACSTARPIAGRKRRQQIARHRARYRWRASPPRCGNLHGHSPLPGADTAAARSGQTTHLPALKRRPADRAHHLPARQIRGQAGPRSGRPSHARSIAPLHHPSALACAPARLHIVPLLFSALAPSFSLLLSTFAPPDLHLPPPLLHARRQPPCV